MGDLLWLRNSRLLGDIYFFRPLRLLLYLGDLDLERDLEYLLLRFIERERDLDLDGDREYDLDLDRERDLLREREAGDLDLGVRERECEGERDFLRSSCSRLSYFSSVSLILL